MFSRRSFLRLSPGPAALAAVPFRDTGNAIDSEVWTDFKGGIWYFRWAGFQRQPDQDAFMGIWYGYPLQKRDNREIDWSRPLTYAAYPGITATRRLWDLQMCMVHYGQNPITHLSTEQDKVEIKDRSLKSLKEFTNDQVATRDWSTEEKRRNSEQNFKARVT